MFSVIYRDQSTRQIWEPGAFLFASEKEAEQEALDLKKRFPHADYCVVHLVPISRAVQADYIIVPFNSFE